MKENIFKHIFECFFYRLLNCKMIIVNTDIKVPKFFFTQLYLNEKLSFKKFVLHTKKFLY